MNSSSNPKTTVICRPGRTWIGQFIYWIILGAIFHALPYLAPRCLSDRAADCIAGVAVGFSAFIATFCATSRVIADDRGLRWNRFGNRRSAPWSGVRGYCEEDIPTGQRASTLLIDTASGRLVVSDLWTHHDQLKSIVDSRTVFSLATGPGALTGAVDRWQRVFRYNRRDALVVLAVCAAIPAILVIRFGWVVARDIHSLGWAMPWTSIVVSDAAPLLLAALYALVAGAAWVPRRDALRRSKDRITVSSRGIVFEDGQRRVESPWADVTEIRIERYSWLQRVIVTRHGEFRYTTVLKDVPLLNATIRRMAVNAGKPKWIA